MVTLRGLRRRARRSVREAAWLAEMDPVRLVGAEEGILGLTLVEADALASVYGVSVWTLGEAALHTPPLFPREPLEPWEVADLSKDQAASLVRLYTGRE